MINLEFFLRFFCKSGPRFTTNVYKLQCRHGWLRHGLL